jgi:hypothetical protein
MKNLVMQGMMQGMMQWVMMGLMEGMPLRLLVQNHLLLPQSKTLPSQQLQVALPIQPNQKFPQRFRHLPLLLLPVQHLAPSPLQHMYV